MSLDDMPWLERQFWSRVDTTGPCWIFTGSRSKNYGLISFAGQSYPMHRAVWEQLVGPIPDGMHLDHLCRNTICCNPDHLEPVTPKENFRRGVCLDTRKPRWFAHEACDRGHDINAEGALMWHGGKRRCRQCKNEYQREYQRQLRAKRRLERQNGGTVNA